MFLSVPLFVVLVSASFASDVPPIVCGPNSTPDICAYIAYPACDAGLTHDNAIEACKVQHPEGRLCTKQEIIHRDVGIDVADPVPWGDCSGVHGNVLVWTSTFCSNGFPYTTTLTNSRAACKAPTNLQPAVCCLDRTAAPTTPPPTPEVACSPSSLPHPFCPFVAFSTCARRVNFEVSENSCSQYEGGRLCTADELRTGAARDATGVVTWDDCDFLNGLKVWSDTVCNPGRRMVVSLDGIRESCARETSREHAAICCKDNAAVPTRFPTTTPTRPPVNPTLRPTQPRPTKTPTAYPTDRPTRFPTNLPTKTPTAYPTDRPTRFPTMLPTNRPVVGPTEQPVAPPPTAFPSTRPTRFPTNLPTTQPTSQPPTSEPTITPTRGEVPTEQPSQPPIPETASPTLTPSRASVETRGPTLPPTGVPSSRPTARPSPGPTPTPTQAPTIRDGFLPSYANETLSVTREDTGASPDCATDGKPCSSIQAAIRALESIDVEQQGGGSDGLRNLAELNIVQPQTPYVVKVELVDDTIQLDSTISLNLDVVHVVFSSQSGVVQITGPTQQQAPSKPCVEIRGTAPSYWERIEFSNCHSRGNGGAIDATKAGGTVNLSLVSFKNNSARGSGGAVAAGTMGASVVAFGCLFQDNTAGMFGGAVHVDGQTVEVVRTEFFSNVASQSGGAIAVESLSSVRCTDASRFVGNKAGRGGAIFAINSPVRLQQVQLSDQVAEIEGGAVASWCATGSQFPVEMDGVQFSNNRALNGNGGHVFGEDCDVDISNTNFNAGNAQSGGALAVLGSAKLNVGSDSLFRANVARVDGGAISARGVAQIAFRSGVILSGNRAGRDGGALFLHNVERVNVTDSVNVLRNVAVSGNGGGAFIGSGDGVIIESASSDDLVFTLNRAKSGGGGGVFFATLPPIVEQDRRLDTSQQSPLTVEQDRQLDTLQFPPALNAKLNNNEASYGADVGATPSGFCVVASSSLFREGCTDIVAQGPAIEAIESALRSGAVTAGDGVSGIWCSMHDVSGAAQVAEFSPGASLSSRLVVVFHDAYNNIAMGSTVSNLIDLIQSTVVGDDSPGGDDDAVITWENHGHVVCPSLNGEWVESQVVVDITSTICEVAQTLDTPVTLLNGGCDAGSVLSKDSQVCGVCPPGTFAAQEKATTGECIPCPDGVGCAGGQLQSERGVWTNEDTAFVCLVTDNCLVDGVGETACVNNRAGPLCAGCEDGYTQIGLHCKDCPTQVGAVVLVVFFLFLWATFVWRCVKKMQDPNMDNSVLKINFAHFTEIERADLGLVLTRITVNHLQMLGIMLLYSVEWPKAVVVFYSVLEVFGFSATSYFGCLFPSHPSFMQQSLLVAFVPIIVALLGLGISYAWEGICWPLRSRVRRTRKGFGSSAPHMGSSSASSPKKMLQLATTTDLIVGTLVVVGSLFYTMQVKMGFQMFACTTNADAGGAYLLADPTVECWTASHWAWAILLGLVVQIIGYGVCIPVALMVVYKRHIEDPSFWRYRFGFFTAGFREGKAYSEVWWFVLKFLFCMSTVLGRFNAEAQVLFGTILFFIVLVVHLDLLVYKEGFVNHYQTLSLAILLLSNCFSMFFWANRESEVENSVVAFIVLFNVFLLLFLVAQIRNIVLDKRAGSFQSKAAKDSRKYASMKETGGDSVFLRRTQDIDPTLTSDLMNKLRSTRSHQSYASAEGLKKKSWSTPEEVLSRTRMNSRHSMSRVAEDDGYLSGGDGASVHSRKTHRDVEQDKDVELLSMKNQQLEKELAKYKSSKAELQDDYIHTQVELEYLESINKGILASQKSRGDRSESVQIL